MTPENRLACIKFRDGLQYQYFVARNPQCAQTLVTFGNYGVWVWMYLKRPFAGSGWHGKVDWYYANEIIPLIEESGPQEVFMTGRPAEVELGELSVDPDLFSYFEVCEAIGSYGLPLNLGKGLNPNFWYGLIVDRLGLEFDSARNQFVSIYEPTTVSYTHLTLPTKRIV